MSAAAELFVKVSADVKGLTRGMDEAAKAIDHIGEETKKAEAPLVRFRDILAGTAAGELLADGIKSAASAMVGMGQQSIKLAGELEQNQVAFTTMLGSASKADAMLRELATFAASTPFELRGLTDSTKKLLAFGFDAQSVIPIMNSVGNAVAAVGGGKDVLDGVTMALGQMAAKGKVSAEEMNQLAERGIPAWKMLADGIGVSVPEAMKKAEKGSIDAGTAITALVNGMNEKFPGMMAKQSQTITGALSNLQDSADAALTKIGQKLIETFNLTRVVQAMSTAISNLTAAFTSGGLLAVLDKAFGPTTKAAILGLGVAITATLIPSITAAATSLLATATAAAPFLAIAAAVAFAAYPIAKNWENIKGTVTALWDTAAQYTSAYYNRAVRIASDLANNFMTAFRYIGDAIRSILGDELTNKLLGGLSRATGAFRGFAETAVTPLRAVGSVASVAASNFADTWRGAMSMSQGFTSGLFNSAAAQTRDFGKKLTADMLGLAKASAAAAGGATKAASAAKAHAAEMKKAEVAARQLEAATARNLKRWQEQEAATYALGQRLAAVMVESSKLGRAFDLAGAQAEAYSQSLSGIKQAFGEFSPQAIQAQQEIDALRASSENGGKAVAEAFKVLDGAALSLEDAKLKAQLLGEEFDANTAAVSQYETAVKQLIDQGLRPGNEQLDEAVKRYTEAKTAKEAATKATLGYGSVLKDFTGTISNIVGSAARLAETFGIKVPEGLAAMGAGIIEAANSAATLIEATKALSLGWTALSVAISTNPVGAALTIAAIALTAFIGAYNFAVDAAKKRADEYTAKLEKAQQAALDAADAQVLLQANLASSDREERLAQETRQASWEKTTEMVASLASATTNAVKQASVAFLAGSSTWASDLRENLKKAMFEGLMDKMVFDALQEQLGTKWKEVGNLLRQGNKEAAGALAKNIAEDAEAMIGPITEGAQMLMKAFGMAPTEVSRLAQQTQGLMNQASQEASRLREQHASTLNNIYKNLERGSPNSERLLAQARILQGRAQPGDEALARGMATGGLVTGPTIARMGEGGRNEAVLPLNENVYRQIGEGIAAARGGGSGVQLVVNYSGSGKWTREDAQGLGRLLVSELRSMGVRA